MIWVRSLLFNILFFGSTAVLAVLSLPVLLLPRAATRALSKIWARWTGFLLRTVSGIDWRVEGREHLPVGPYVLAIKHQSAWDTLFYVLMVEDPAVVLKQELTWIPIFGWFLMRNGMIPIDRRSGAAAIRKMIKSARARLAEGRPVVIAPEGTRTAPGQRVPYQPGVAAFYSQLDVPVVPAALNAGLFWRRRGFLKKPGTIVVEFLEPIAPGMDRKAFLELLATRIEDATDRLVADAVARGAELPLPSAAKPGDNPGSHSDSDV